MKRKKTVASIRVEERARDLEQAVQSPPSPEADPVMEDVVREEDIGHFARVAKRKTKASIAAVQITSRQTTEETGQMQPARSTSKGRKVRIGETASRPLQLPPAWLTVPLSIGAVALAVWLGMVALFPRPSAMPAPAVVNPPPVTTQEDPVPMGSAALWSRQSMPSLTSLSDPKSVASSDALRVPTLPRGQLPASPAASERAARLAAQRPGDPSAQHQAGVAALSRGDTVAARGYFEVASTLAPFATAPLLNLAQLDFEEGLYEQAAERFARFRRIESGHVVGAYRALVCDLILDRSPTFDEQVLRTNSPAGLYARAALAWKAGDPTTARDFAAKARALGSRNTSRFEADLLLLGYHEEASPQ